MYVYVLLSSVWLVAFIAPIRNSYAFLVITTTGIEIPLRPIHHWDFANFQILSVIGSIENSCDPCRPVLLSNFWYIWTQTVTVSVRDFHLLVQYFSRISGPTLCRRVRYQNSGWVICFLRVICVIAWSWVVSCRSLVSEQNAREKRERRSANNEKVGREFRVYCSSMKWVTSSVINAV